MEESNSTFWRSMYNKPDEEKGQALLQRLGSIMPFTRWGFQKTHTDFSGYLRVIYDSGWCRVKFLYRRGRYKDPDLDEFSIDYGRLHAPDDQGTMIWQGEKCNCWHNNRLALYFLDGLTPEEVGQREKEGKTANDVRINFRQSPTGQRLVEEKLWAEFIIQHEAKTWQHYGERLFKIFDLQQSELWKKYTHYVKEYHRIIGTPAPRLEVAHILAPQTSIC